MVTESFSLCIHLLPLFWGGGIGGGVCVYLETCKVSAGFLDVFYPAEVGIADGDMPEMQFTFLYKR